MYNPEKIAALSDADLKNLAANAARLVLSGTMAQVAEAARITPMIEHEQAARVTAKAEAAAEKKAAKPPAKKKAPAKAKAV